VEAGLAGPRRVNAEARRGGAPARRRRDGAQWAETRLGRARCRRGRRRRVPGRRELVREGVDKERGEGGWIRRRGREEEGESK
jgi:hypothetical protein